jgi:thymidylate synthase
LTCKKCNNIFNNRQSKWRHEKKCDGPLLKNLSVLKNEIEELKKIIKTSNSVSIQNSNNISNSNNTINNTMVNNFNNDNLSYLTPQFFKKLLKECLFEEDHINLLPKVIEEVKFSGA